MCRVINLNEWKRERTVRAIRPRQGRVKIGRNPGFVSIGDVTADILRRLTE
jgi:hypothetical protein